MNLKADCTAAPEDCSGGASIAAIVNGLLMKAAEDAS
jgi:hypothetical protein